MSFRKIGRPTAKSNRDDLEMSFKSYSRSLMRHWAVFLAMAEAGGDNDGRQRKKGLKSLLTEF
jgi:hypothetical protein